MRLTHGRLPGEPQSAVRSRRARSRAQTPPIRAAAGMRLSRPMATWATASIQSRGVSPRLTPRSNRSTSDRISLNSGSSASLRSSRRATSASRRSTTTLVRSAASMRAACIAALSGDGGSLSPAATLLFRPHMALSLKGRSSRKGKIHQCVRMPKGPSERAGRANGENSPVPGRFRQHGLACRRAFVPWRATVWA